MKLIDTHQHLIYREEISYSWTNEIKILSKNNFTIQDYKNLTNEFDIEGTIFMETGVDDNDYKKEFNFINSLKENKENNIFGIIASIRPETKYNFDSWLEETIDMDVLGYRRILHEINDDVSQSDIFRNNIRKIGKASKTFDMCFLAKQLPLAIELASKCDNTILVLNHCGVPDISSESLDPWRDDIKSLSLRPNVICKLSGLMAYCKPNDSSFEKIEPYVDHVLNCFGSNRILWGSDWPVVNLGKGLKEWIKISHSILNNLSIDEATKIGSETAKKIYKINYK